MLVVVSDRASMESRVRGSFNVTNFGCRATQADGAGIAAELIARGLERTGDASVADIVVVNTCTVTAEADRDARQSIRRIHRENPKAEILVTGCYAQRRPSELAALGGVKWVVGNSHKHHVGHIVAPQLVQISGVTPPALEYHSGIESGGTLVGDFSGRFVSGLLPHGDPLGRARPNVKVQDGCHNRCSFCIIPSVRGGSRSAPVANVVREVRSLEGSYPEIVLTGINLGRWGRDLEGRPRLVELLQGLLAETDVRRIRLSSIEPMDWSENLLRLMASSPRIARHVHIPLQSGSDAVLRRMRRRYRIRHYESRLRLARQAMPAAAIGADVMVGFPGETEADFEQTRAFVERMPFTYLHVFSYSAREGTDAAQLGGQVAKAVKRDRSQVLRRLIERKNTAFRRSMLGTKLSAVTLASSDSGTRALSDNFIETEIPNASIPSTQLVDVRVEAADQRRTISSIIS